MENQNQEPIELSAEEVRAKAKQLLDEWKIVYLAEFVPQSKSRTATLKDPQINWKIYLGRLTKPWSITTDYSQGIGHVPDYAQDYAQDWGKTSSNKTRYYRAVAEEGQYVPRKNLPLFSDKRTDYWKILGERTTINPMLKPKKLPSPNVADVLYSLVLDSDVLDYTNFEDWADNLGYESDSRSAEKIYQSCMEIALKMRSLFGEDKLEQLRTLFENY